MTSFAANKRAKKLRAYRVEQIEYDKTEFFSDVGGAAGLLLGISLTSLIGMLGNIKQRNTKLSSFLIILFLLFFAFLFLILLYFFIVERLELIYFSFQNMKQEMLFLRCSTFQILRNENATFPGKCFFSPDPLSTRLNKTVVKTFAYQFWWPLSRNAKSMSGLVV